MKILQGKQALITGGSEGIGLAIAEHFVSHGASVLLIGRNSQKLDAACAKLQSLIDPDNGQNPADQHQQIASLSADLSDQQALATMVDDVQSLMPQLDILVNNVGMARFEPFGQVSVDSFDQMWATNVKTAFFLTQMLLEPLIASRGNVINLSSYFSRKMIPNRPSSVYSLTKGAIDALTLSLAHELGEYGIRVNAIAPGTVKTAMFNRSIATMSDSEQQQFINQVTNRYPLNRLGEGRDIAALAGFLASDQAAWITGAIIHADGGLTTG